MSTLGLAALGVILLILGFILAIKILVTIGWIVLVIGLVLVVLDFFMSRGGGGGLFGSRRV